jgi:uncharacterized protein (TIRG00374 family)
MQFIIKYRRYLRWVGVLALIGLVLFLRVDLRETFALLTRANGWLVLLSVLGFVPFLLSKAWRWQVILRDLGVPIPFREAVRLYALGLGAGMLTPGQIGDAVKIAYFRDRGFGQSIISILLDRLWDVLILVVLAGIGALFFVQLFEGEWIAILLVFAATVAIFAAVVNPRSQKWLFGQLRRVRKHDDALANYEPQPLTFSQILLQFVLSVIATVIVYARLYLLTAALGIQLAPLPFVAAMSLATIAALLPISMMGGVGTRDTALLLIAPIIGISSAEALALSTLILFIQLVNGIVGFGVWLLEKPAEDDSAKDALRRTTDDGGRTPSDERRKTKDEGQRKTDDGGRTTGNEERRTTDDERKTVVVPEPTVANQKP